MGVVCSRFNSMVLLFAQKRKPCPRRSGGFLRPLERRLRVIVTSVFCSCWPSQFHDPHPNVRNNVLAGRIMVVEVLAATTMSAEVRTHTRLESHAVASALFDFPL